MVMVYAGIACIVGFVLFALFTRKKKLELPPEKAICKSLENIAKVLNVMKKSTIKHTFVKGIYKGRTVVFSYSAWDHVLSDSTVGDSTFRVVITGFPNRVQKEHPLIPLVKHICPTPNTELIRKKVFYNDFYFNNDASILEQDKIILILDELREALDIVERGSTYHSEKK